MAKIIVFDFDGTLADTVSEFVRIVNILAEKYKFNKIDEKDIPKLRNYDVLGMLKELQIPLWKVAFIARDGKEELHKTIDRVKPIPQIKKQLQQLHKQGFTLGVLTSNSKENVIKFLAKNDMDFFDFIYTGSNIFGKDKVIQSMLQKKDFRKKDVLYVGDESRDIQAAHKVGIKIVSVSWGFNSESALKKHKPDFLISKPESLAPLIDQMAS